MILILGLGNPGKKFERTRHNLGFRILDFFQKKWNFPSFRLQKEIDSLTSQGEFLGKKIILAKPQTFMNQSGKAVKKIKKKFKIKNENIIVIHDELDLPLGKTKFSFKKGTAGHKGVASLVQSLKTKDFFRYRLGIGKEKRKNFVLEEFSVEEEKILKKIFEKAFQDIQNYLSKIRD
ncbi:MAG: aminoacyl-tRNA hydrolase [Minisyncoccales bacterium]